MDLEWIIKGLEKPGKSRIGLAKALHRSPSAVTALLSGKRELKAREIETIAKYLEVEDRPPVLAFGKDGSIEFMGLRPASHQIGTASIVGDVAAGVWSEPHLNFDPIPTTVAIDARWADGSVYLLRVRGSSINRQAKDGDLVLCLELYEAPRDFQHGDWVVAQRTAADGRIETTVKKVQGSKRDGFLLLPDSDDPAFQQPIRLGKHDGETVEVKAFVLEFIKPAVTF